MNAVVNTAPLLFLTRIGRLSVLREFGSILVPEAVVSEVRYKRDDETSSVNKALDEWLKISIVSDKNLLAVLEKELGRGEAEVIALAIEQNIGWVILDDQDARRFAHRYGLNVIGTLGLLAWGKRKNLIESLRDKIKKLNEAGLYATKRLIEELLREVGE
jgi:predicted nucleic acid-binding protein